MSAASVFESGPVTVNVDVSGQRWLNSELSTSSEPLGPYDYDRLHLCPFCGQLTMDECPHHIATLKFGSWPAGLEPLLYWNGHCFDRNRLERAAAGNQDVRSQEKPGTWSHPRARAYFAATEDPVREIEENSSRPVIMGCTCQACGTSDNVVDEYERPLCAVCGRRVPSAEDLDDWFSAAPRS